MIGTPVELISPRLSSVAEQLSSSVAEQPSYVAEQPSSVAEQPSSVAEQPSSVVEVAEVTAAYIVQAAAELVYHMEHYTVVAGYGVPPPAHSIA